MMQSQDGLVRFASAAVVLWVEEQQVLTLDRFLSADAALTEQEKSVLRGPASGAFVTLYRHGRLRGCIGTIEPAMDSLARELASNAVSACSMDPRFPPVRVKELETLDVHVDVLQPPDLYNGPRNWDVRRYGVVVSGPGGRRGLLLPDLDGVDSAEEQVAIASRKAGVHQKDIQSIHLFEVRRHT